MASTATLRGQTGKDKTGFSDRLLDWYDDNARTLPWRTGPAARRGGQMPDPYRVWLSEVMLQQTTVATVSPRFETFLRRWPTVADLAAAPIDDVLGEWAGLGYYARARNLHACAVAVTERFGGQFPDTEEELLTLPGIGQYTAAAVAAIAFDRPATVVDGNVDRVIVRQFALDRPVREIKPEIYAHAADLTPVARAGDYAQAMMDLGATVCRPKSPQCLLCPVRISCDAHAEGIASDLPMKPAKKARPTRYGHVYAAVNRAGAVVTEKRADKGLFGGMAGLPTSDWSKDGLPDRDDPFPADWVEEGAVEHTLTHFHLVLTVWRAGLSRLPKGYQWTEDMSTLPTVFRKAVEISA
ncbi:A/G-specific adenine glycosylase [Parvularcula sp. LCG005]|uniref:A/G-specific adenine glycosylase n=1 Tax=Parvularcula sp. LCG005 TaxID=3078805 RepID=UPI002943D4BA|nr:A/G-specific adenine glycosylase [Parvularcula sp. LCG005]WOI52830.1 A/G-specific adenine glycosylase [Parvularcula sp. LCG005]